MFDSIIWNIWIVGLAKMCTIFQIVKIKKLFVDRTVYTANRCFRIFDSSKIGQKRYSSHRLYIRSLFRFLIKPDTECLGLSMNLHTSVNYFILGL